MSDSKSTKQVKVISTGLIFGAIALQIWQIISPLPQFLQSVATITQIVLVIHAAEGIIAALLIALYRWRMKDTPTQQTSSLLIDHLPSSTPAAIIKAGLYAFFVGTVGLSEIIQATKNSSEQPS